MARSTKTRSTGLMLIVIKTAKKPNGFPMGTVEQCSVNQSHRSELQYEYGRQTAVENVYHGVDRADVSWTRAETIKEESMTELGVTPEDLELAAHEPIGVLMIDIDRGDTLCEVEEVLPTSIGISGGAMSKLVSNFSGSGVQVRWISELN